MPNARTREESGTQSPFHKAKHKEKQHKKHKNNAKWWGWFFWFHFFFQETFFPLGYVKHKMADSFSHCSLDTWAWTGTEVMWSESKWCGLNSTRKKQKWSWFDQMCIKQRDAGTQSHNFQWEWHLTSFVSKLDKKYILDENEIWEVFRRTWWCRN